MPIPLVICKSHYTFLEGMHSISDLVNFAAGNDIKALCLADKNGLYGAVEFYILCQEANIQPLIGAELVQGERHVTIIATNMEGYGELSELVTRYHLGSLHIEDDLFPDSPNLLYICCDNFLLQRWLPKTTGNHLLLALTLSNRRSFRSVLNLISRRSDLPHVPAVPVVQLNLLYPSDRTLYKVLRAIHLGCTVDTLPEEERSIEEGEGMGYSFCPYEPVVSGVDIAKLSHLRFDLQQYHLPKFTPVR